MHYGQPPAWQVLAAVVGLTVPAGLLAVWLALTIFDRVTRRPPREHLLDDF